MANRTEHFVKGSDNAITLTLLEAAVASTITATEINIDIGGLVTITRTPDGTGIAFVNGVLTITPRSLTEDLSALKVGQLYRTKVVVKSSGATSGVVFGASDSNTRLFFLVRSNPV